MYGITKKNHQKPQAAMILKSQRGSALQVCQISKRTYFSQDSGGGIASLQARQQMEKDQVRELWLILIGRVRG